MVTFLLVVLSAITLCSCETRSFTEVLQEGKIYLNKAEEIPTEVKYPTDYPFQNVSLRFEHRVEDLVNRLTLDELVDQLAMGGSHTNGPSPAIPRLNIKAYQWDTECLHGYAFTGDATLFPSPIGLAATFDPPLIEEMGRVISWEARAKFNYFANHHMDSDHTGLSCFAPFINIMRHPLWGRNQESYGEDPFLTGMFGKHYVTGLQGHNDRYAAATAVCKHFDVHGGPEDHPNRFGFNAVVSERDWRMTHIPAFRACLEANPYGVMCSYNAINGVPSCANKKLLTDILRGEMGFTGYIVSDEGAVAHIDSFFNFTKNFVQTAEVAIKAGVSLLVSDQGDKDRFFFLKEAVHKGLVSIELLRERARPLFYTRFKLGQFDPPSMNPYSNISMDVVQSVEHRELANTITSKSFVLLKNNGALPLKRIFENVAIVGPFALNSEALSGDYPSQFETKYFSSPLEGVQRFSSNPVKLVKGCMGEAWDQNLPKCEDIDEDDVIPKVIGADLIVVTLGTGWGIETEGLDRTGLELPGKQLALIKLIAEFANDNAQIVVLLFNAGPVDVTWLKNSKRIDAMIACHFPAQSAGEAIYRVLSGQENPAGRLPNTWPAGIYEVPPITNYTMFQRTYRYSTYAPLYPFGYGLSYTSFYYRGLSLNGQKFDICSDVVVKVSVTNTGEIYGEEVAQVYLKWMGVPLGIAPQLQLVAFNRVAIYPGKTIEVYFTIKADQRAVWTDRMMLEPGSFMIYVGGQQPNQETKAPSNVLSKEFIVSGKSRHVQKCLHKSA